MIQEELLSRHKIFIPPSLPKILKNYAKSAIRTQPRDLLLWSRHYFSAMAEERQPPVKRHLEVPPLREAQSGLSPGLLRVLITQIGDMNEVPKEIIADKWEGICLEKKYLEILLKIGNFSDPIEWDKFVAIAAGSIEKELRGTMLLLLELLGDADGRLEVELCLELYKYLARLDCGPPQQSISGVPMPRKGRKIKPCSFPPLHKGRLPIPYDKWKDLQSLKALIPSDCHAFYDSLPHTGISQSIRAQKRKRNVIIEQVDEPSGSKQNNAQDQNGNSLEVAEDPSHKEKVNPTELAVNEMVSEKIHLEAHEAMQSSDQETLSLEDELKVEAKSEEMPLIEEDQPHNAAQVEGELSESEAKDRDLPQSEALSEGSLSGIETQKDEELRQSELEGKKDVEQLQSEANSEGETQQGKGEFLESETEVRSELHQSEAEFGSELHQSEADVKSEVDVKNALPQSEAEVRSELSQSKADVRSEPPQSEAEVRSELPQSEADVKSELPQSETEVQLENSQSEAEVKSELPQSEAEVTSELPQSETEAKVNLHAESEGEEPQTEVISKNEQLENVSEAEENMKLPESEPQGNSEMPLGDAEVDTEMLVIKSDGGNDSHDKSSEDSGLPPSETTESQSEIHLVKTSSSLSRSEDNIPQERSQDEVEDGGTEEEMELPGIGPVVPLSIIEKVEAYLRRCAAHQSDMVIPRNFRHHLSPPLY